MAAPFAISCGDPAGIGSEIIAKSWRLRGENNLPPFFAVGDAAAVEQCCDVPVQRIENPADAAEVFNHALPIMHVHSCDAVTPGKPTLDGAQCALHALEVACGLSRTGDAGALVTGPVSKAQLFQIGFTFPGQTEFVSERCGIARENGVMMLAGPDLRVVPITTHIPLVEVAEKLTIDLVAARIRAAHKAMVRNFGIENPRIAIAGFNPHAGESGALGSEEVTILNPAIEMTRSEGMDIIGPLAADTMFHETARTKYDVALCAYHDQALVPLKTLYFYEGVNMTLGLPIVRTSPDHGTAFEIAGKDLADPRSMIAAIKMAETAVANRAIYDV